MTPMTYIHHVELDVEASVPAEQVGPHEARGWSEGPLPSAQAARDRAHLLAVAEANDHARVTLAAQEAAKAAADKALEVRAEESAAAVESAEPVDPPAEDPPAPQEIDRRDVRRAVGGSLSGTNTNPEEG